MPATRLTRRIAMSTTRRRIRRWRNAIATAALACLIGAFGMRGPISDWLFMFFLLLMLVHSVFSEQF